MVGTVDISRAHSITPVVFLFFSFLFSLKRPFQNHDPFENNNDNRRTFAGQKEHVAG